MPTHPVGEKPFSHTQPEPPLTQLHAIPSGSVTGPKSVEISVHPFSSLLEDVQGHNEISPQSPLIRAEKTKRPQ